MNVLILSAKKNVFHQDGVDCVSVNTTSGLISIYQDHMDLISRIDEGAIIVTKGDEDFYFVAIDGLVYVTENTVKILVGNAISVEEIDEQASLKARNEAEKMLEKDDLEATEIAYLEAVVRREDIKINLSKLSKIKRVKH